MYLVKAMKLSKYFLDVILHEVVAKMLCIRENRILKTGGKVLGGLKGREPQFVAERCIPSRKRELENIYFPEQGCLRFCFKVSSFHDLLNWTAIPAPIFGSIIVNRYYGEIEGDGNLTRLRQRQEVYCRQRRQSESRRI